EAQGVEEKSVLEIQGACDHEAHTRCDGEPPGGFVDGTEPQPAAKGQHKENTQCCPTRGGIGDKGGNEIGRDQHSHDADNERECGKRGFFRCSLIHSTEVCRPKHDCCRTSQRRNGHTKTPAETQSTRAFRVKLNQLTAPMVPSAPEVPAGVRQRYLPQCE